MLILSKSTNGKYMGKKNMDWLVLGMIEQR